MNSQATGSFISRNLPRLNLTSGFFWTLGIVLSLVQLRTARAEDSLTVKAQSYQEDPSQGTKRIRVDSQYTLVEADITPDAHLKVMGLLDTITGSSPTGEMVGTYKPGEVPTARIKDREYRKAWDANLAYQFKRVNVAVSYGNSRESDYVSNGYSVNTLTDFNQKNTMLLLGWGHTDDRIMFHTANKDRAKTGDDLIVGVTQLVSPEMSVTANISYGRSTGFMSDPYKSITSPVDPRLPPFIPGPFSVPENRPSQKDKVSVFLGTNRHFSRLNGALDGSYRFYSDTFGIISHTVELKWVQRIGEHFTVEPVVRYSRQSAADFYYTDLGSAGIIPNFDPSDNNYGTGKGPYYSSDYRLSKMETCNLGLKLSCLINDHCSFDVAYERYLMRGLDHVTPQDAYAKAGIFTVGFKLSL